MRRLIVAGLLLVPVLSTRVVAQRTDASHAEARGMSIAGTLRDSAGRGVPNARVALVGSERVTYSNGDGRYRFDRVADGRYVLRITRLGTKPVTSDSIRVPSDDGLREVVRDLVLPSAAIALSQLTITPGSFTLLDQTAASRLSLSREALHTAPQLAEDVFRSLSRLPGLSGSDYSAKIRVRNGGVDEQLVTLDGLELIEPFHLKDFDGALSILDGEAIGRVTVTTGGFTAPSGNRLTGLIDMSSVTPNAESAHASVGLSVSNMRAGIAGVFAGGKGSWVVSGRRGYLDLLFKLIHENDPPDLTYYDVFGKLQYQLSTNHIGALHVLVANDRLRMTASDSSTVVSAYTNRYVWGTLQSRVSERLTATTLLSTSALAWHRDVRDVQRLRSIGYDRVRIADRRSMQALSVKQDWTFDATTSVSLLFGAESRGEDASLDYANQHVERAVVTNKVVVLDSSRIDAALSPDGARASGYATMRLRPIQTLTAELGARADRHGWTGQSTVSPRTNIAWTPRAGITLRGAWGLYHQAQSLQDLSIVDGDTAFAQAERAEHRILGVEVEMPRGWTARAEAFQRVLTSPRARYLNVDGGFESAIPETDKDRIRFAPLRARVQGVELLTQYDRGGSLRGGASLVFSHATADFASYTTVRPFDEPLAATMDASYRSARGWSISGAWTSHSGWPTMRPTFVVDTIAAGRYAVRRLPSPVNFNERFSPYARLDVRATRSWPTTHGRVNLWADLFNILNRRNQRGYEYHSSLASSTRVTVLATPTAFLGRLPTLGVSWEF